MPKGTLTDTERELARTWGAVIAGALIVIAMAVALAAQAKAQQAAQPQDVPAQSPAPLQGEVVTIQQIILLVLQQMQGQQVETNRLLSAIAAPTSSRTIPQGACQ